MHQATFEQLQIIRVLESTEACYPADNTKIFSLHYWYLTDGEEGNQNVHLMHIKNKVQYYSLDVAIS